MKIKTSLKCLCKFCIMLKRKNKLRVICPRFSKHKQRQK